MVGLILIKNFTQNLMRFTDKKTPPVRWGNNNFEKGVIETINHQSHYTTLYAKHASLECPAR
jgi:hypothetical protein